MNEQLRMLEGYFGLMNMNGAARVYRTAVETGLLDALRQGPAPADELARRCGLAERPTALVLGVLRGLRLVAVEEGRCALTPLASFLVDGPYRDLGDRYWDTLTELLRSGSPALVAESPDQLSRRYREQAAALAWMLSPAADAAAQELGVGRARRNLNVLDLGAGSAVWSLAMARRDAGTHVTAVDLAAVLEFAVRSARAAGVEDRFEAVPGDFHRLVLPDSTFDLVIIGNVVHLQAPPANAALLEKARAALKPEGELVVFDVFAGQGAADLDRELYALGLALRTRHGHVYAREELEQMLADTGFAPTAFTPLSAPPSVVSMLRARPAAKPRAGSRTRAESAA